MQTMASNLVPTSRVVRASFSFYLFSFSFTHTLFSKTDGGTPSTQRMPSVQLRAVAWRELHLDKDEYVLADTLVRVEVVRAQARAQLAEGDARHRPAVERPPASRHRAGQRRVRPGRHGVAVDWRRG